jgi:hypothetical protein
MKINLPINKRPLFSAPSFTTSAVVGLTLLNLTSFSQASTLLYPRSQSLGGWHERSFSSSWFDLQPDVTNLVQIDANGDFRGFNHPTTTVWLQSPEFVLSPGGSISISQIYLMENSEPPPLSTASVNPSKSPTGWAGIALIDSSGSVVFTYSQTSVWESVIFTSESLALLAGETLTLNFISSNNSSSDFFYVNRPIEIGGTLIPEPSIPLLASLACLPVLRRRRR